MLSTALQRQKVPYGGKVLSIMINQHTKEMTVSEAPVRGLQGFYEQITLAFPVYRRIYYQCIIYN